MPSLYGRLSVLRTQSIRRSTSRSLMLFALLAGCGESSTDPADALVPQLKDQGLDLGTDLEDGSIAEDQGDSGVAPEDGGPCGENSNNAGAPASCGQVELRACAECRGVHECGAGPSNFVPIVNCENCPARVDSHVCEAGRCRILGVPGALRVRFSIPPAAAGAESFIAAAFNSTAGNGDKLRCAELQSSCMLTDNTSLNATNVAFQLFTAPADPGLIYVTTFGAEAGEDRLIMLIVTEARTGSGRVLGTGCLENVLVGSEGPTEIAIEVHPK